MSTPKYGCDLLPETNYDRRDRKSYSGRIVLGYGHEKKIKHTVVKPLSFVAKRLESKKKIIFDSRRKYITLRL